MILDVAYSVNGVPIRLTDERWEHIVDRKPHERFDAESVLDTVEQPTYILRGQSGALVAVKPFGRSKYLHVAYRELTENDGFIITAFTRERVNKRQIIWREEN